MSSSTASAQHTSTPSAPPITRILVVGAGQMGSGIAQVFAQSGRHVLLVDEDRAALDRARSGIAASADKLLSKGHITDEHRGWVADRVTFAQLDDEHATEHDLAIEAIVELERPKRELLARLDRALPEHAIIASNTSSIPITALAAATSRPSHVVGMHFMNPVPMLDLVEVIPGIATDPTVTARICELARQLGKVPVESADTPGFITNRVLMPLINEAFFCLQDGVGTAEAIDDAMRLGMRHPLGPLALADLIGLDTCLHIMDVLHAELGDRSRPCPLIRRHVEAGRLGRKSGAGVYRYDGRR
jgi:3-hydroxybutyryl-CoA dehydrogenase